VWVADEYLKLVEYDKPTYEQPVATFQCHATPDWYCHGWAVVHSNRGHEYELLALRFRPCEIPQPKVPLFESGAAAAAHGIRRMTRKSRQAIGRLQARYRHLRAPK
jgi:hypothetical protein